MGDSEITSAEVNGFNVETNTGETPEEITESLKTEEEAEEEADELSEAASELGKRGAKAAAKARQKAAKEAKKAEAEQAAEEPQETDEPEEQEAKGEESEEEEAEEEDKKPPKNKRDARTRVLEATRQAAEAKRERDELRREVEYLRKSVEEARRPPQEQKEPAPQDGDKEPIEDDFDNYRDYVRAAARWEARQEFKQQQEARTREQQQRALDDRLVAQINKFGDAIRPHVDTFSPEVLALKTEFQLRPGERPTASNWIANELFTDTENAPALMSHFTEHPDVLQRIAALPTPRDVTREMAILVTRLTAASPTGSNGAEREEVSKAKPPVKPVAGAPYVADGTKAPKEGEDFDAWLQRTRPAVIR